MTRLIPYSQYAMNSRLLLAALGSCRASESGISLKIVFTAEHKKCSRAKNSACGIRATLAEMLCSCVIQQPIYKFIISTSSLQLSIDTNLERNK